jgi:hypothetical protein
MSPEELEEAQGELSSPLQIVYILTNPSMPGIVKIGRTGNLEARVAALSCGTSIPEPFEVAYAATVDNAPFVERALHAAFAMHRMPGKEFFRLPVASAIAALSLAEVEQVVMEVADEEPTQIISEVRQRGALRESDREAICTILKQAGKPLSNQELAGLMGVTPGESSKRCRQAHDLLEIGRQGKELRIQLRRTA